MKTVVTNKRAISKIILEVEKFRPFAIDTKGVEKLTEDIRKNGLLVPLTIWKRGKLPKFEYVLISGHHRLEAVKKLGYKEVPCNAVEFEFEHEAIIASYALNAQDEYSSNNRNWYDRFDKAEVFLKEAIKKRMAMKKGGKGKKEGKKERADDILCAKAGLGWSYKKYGKMRVVYEWLNSKKLSGIITCIKYDVDFSVNAWHEFAIAFGKGEYGDKEIKFLKKEAKKLIDEGGEEGYKITKVIRGLCKENEANEKESEEVKKDVSKKIDKSKYCEIKNGEVQLDFSVLNDEEEGREVYDMVLRVLEKEKKLIIDRVGIKSNKGQISTEKVIIRKK